jgi:hypothetical protein
VTTLCMADYVPPRSADVLPFPALAARGLSPEQLLRRVRFAARAAGAVGDQVTAVETHAQEMINAGVRADKVMDATHDYATALVASAGARP